VSSGGNGRGAAPGAGAGVEKRLTAESWTGTGRTWRSESAVVRCERRGRAPILGMTRIMRAAILVVVVVTGLVVAVVSIDLGADTSTWDSPGRTVVDVDGRKRTREKFIWGPPACNSNVR
jgi:hypothetical protein